MTDHAPALPPILAEATVIYFGLSAMERAGNRQWRINSRHMAQLEATQPPRDPDDADEPVTDAPAYLFGFPMVVDDSVTEMTLEPR